MEAPLTLTRHTPLKRRPRLLCILAPPLQVEAPPTRTGHASSKRRPRLLCILATPLPMRKPLLPELATPPRNAGHAYSSF